MPEQTLPQTCEVLDWPCFVDGFHKGDLYPDADLERMERNFQLLSADDATYRKLNGQPYLIAVGKLGHDKKQRAANKLAEKFGQSKPDRRMTESWGGINLGRIKSLRRGGPDGEAVIHLVNVPTEIGAKMNAGLINSGSIEIIPSIPNPANPAEQIRGPICTAVSYLGEEQPALKEIGQPRAVFADGTPVPPDYRVNEWLDVFAEVAKESDLEGEPDKSYSAMSRKFSAYADAQERVMNDEEKAKAFAAKFAHHFSKNFAGPEPGSDAFKAMKAKEDPNYVWYDDKDYSAAFAECGLPETEKKNPAFAAFASKFSQSFSKAFAGDMPDAGAVPVSTATPAAASPAATATPADGQMAALMAEIAGLKKQMGALEADAIAKKAQETEAQMAAFSAEVDNRCKTIVRKVTPIAIETYVKPTALAILTTKKFASEIDRRKEFDDFFKPFESLPDDTRLATVTQPNIAATGSAALPSDALTMISGIGRKGGVMDRLSPTAAARVQRMTGAAM